MTILRQSTAAILKLGPFLDATDFVTPETTLSIGQADIQVSKSGGAYAQTSASSPTTTHDADGWYPIPLTATDTATVGPLAVQVAVTGALPVWVEHQVVEEAVFDAFWASGAVGITPTAVQAASTYHGPHGPAIHVDTNLSNTSTVFGTDGTAGNPVSTLAAARTLVSALGHSSIYLTGGSSVDIDAAMTGYSFYGVGERTSNSVNLNGQDVSDCVFERVIVEGDHAGTRIEIRDGAIRELAGAGSTTLNCLAVRCAFIDSFEVDTSADNIFDQCFSAVAGTGAPSVIATGAAGTMVFRHYSGGLEFQSLSGSHDVSVECDGQVIFAASCSIAATVAVRGNCTITDNTTGLLALSDNARFDFSRFNNVSAAEVNAEVDTALADYDAPTKAELDSGLAALNDLSAAAVNAEVDTALADYDAPTKAELDSGLAALNDLTAAQVNAEVDTALADYDAPTKAELDAGLAALNDVSVADILTTQMTEAYAAAGVAPTVAQALHMILSALLEKSVVSTTLTNKKLDGSTTAMTSTLDDAATPTSVTRTS